MHVVNILLCPLSHIFHKTIIVMSARKVKRTVLVQSGDLVHQGESHVFVFNVQDYGGFCLVDFTGKVMLLEFFINVLHITSVVLVYEIKEMISKKDLLFVNFSLSESVEDLINEILHIVG